MDKQFLDKYTVITSDRIKSGEFKKLKLINLEEEFIKFAKCNACNSLLAYTVMGETDSLLGHTACCPAGGMISEKCTTENMTKVPPQRSKADIVLDIFANEEKYSYFSPPNAKSEVWQRFHLIKLNEEPLNLARCIECKYIFSYTQKTGTGNLLRHVCPTKKRKRKQSNPKQADTDFHIAENDHSFEKDTDDTFDKEQLNEENLDVDHQSNSSINKAEDLADEDNENNKCTSAPQATVKKTPRKKSDSNIKKASIELDIRQNEDKYTFFTPVGAKSGVWNQFKLIKLGDQLINYARCNTCKFLLSYSTKTGTGSLLRHVCSIYMSRKLKDSQQTDNEGYDNSINDDDDDDNDNDDMAVENEAFDEEHSSYITADNSFHQNINFIKIEKVEEQYDQYEEEEQEDNSDFSALLSPICNMEAGPSSTARKKIESYKRKAQFEIEINQHEESYTFYLPAGAKSGVWKKFKLIKLGNEIIPFARCNGCKSLLSYTSKTGTGSLLRHMCPSSTDSKSKRIKQKKLPSLKAQGPNLIAQKKHKSLISHHGRNIVNKDLNKNDPLTAVRHHSFICERLPDSDNEDTNNRYAAEVNPYQRPPLLYSMDFQ